MPTAEVQQTAKLRNWKPNLLENLPTLSWVCPTFTWMTKRLQTTMKKDHRYPYTEPRTGIWCLCVVDSTPDATQRCRSDVGPVDRGEAATLELSLEYWPLCLLASWETCCSSEQVSGTFVIKAQKNTQSISLVLCFISHLSFLSEMLIDNLVLYVLADSFGLQNWLCILTILYLAAALLISLQEFVRWVDVLTDWMVIFLKQLFMRRYNADLNNISCVNLFKFSEWVRRALKILMLHYKYSIRGLMCLQNKMLVLYWHKEMNRHLACRKTTSLILTHVTVTHFVTFQW